MASICPRCGSTEDWYDLADGRTRCPNCYETSEVKGADKKAKDELASRDSTDKTTTAPPVTDPDVAPKASKKKK